MDKFLLSLLFCSLEMSAVSLVYIGLLRALKNRQSPVLRYYSWLIIIVGFLIPIKPSFGDTAVTVTEPAAYVTPLQIQNTARNVNSYDIAFMVWLLIAAVYLITYFCRYRIFRKSITRLSRPADAYTRSVAEQVANSLGISAPVRVMIMGEISSPMMTGLLSPTILLPERCFADDDLRLILKHELTHFKHKDLWFRLLFTLCRAAHWFNPMMHFISRSIDEECEHWCDYSVIKGESTELKKLYCHSILDTVSAQSRAGKMRIDLVMATNFYTPKQSLKHRMSLILSDKRKKRFAAAGIIAAGLTIASGSVIGFAAGERIVSDSDVVMTTTTTTMPKEEASPVVTTTRPLETTTFPEEGQPPATSTVDTEPTKPIVTDIPANPENASRDTVSAPYVPDEPVYTTAPVYENQFVDTTTVTWQE